MRIAFYAPLKAPTHGTPSGDRRVAGLLIEALRLGGHQVELVSTFRSLDREGDPVRQAALRDQGTAFAATLVERWRSGPPQARPDLWFTYHVYYKAPDWLGPAASSALGIGYVIAEASHAPKRAGGPWAIGHDAALAAISHADLVLSPTRYDLVCLQPLRPEPERLALLPPFLDTAPFHAARGSRDAVRQALAASRGLDASVPWVVVAAMMRPGDKLASYRQLAGALGRLRDLPWQLLIAGDGQARTDVEAAFATSAPGRAHYLGALSLETLAEIYTACDLCVWPAVNEAYGMAMLEAQAAGLPVVSCALRGVPDIVEHGRTGLLAPAGDLDALAAHARTLIADVAQRRRMGEAARAFVDGDRSLTAAADQLSQALSNVVRGRVTHGR